MQDTGSFHRPGILHHKLEFTALMRQWIIDNGKLKIMVFPAEIIEIVRKAHTINSQLSIFNSQFLLGVSPINNHL